MHLMRTRRFAPLFATQFFGAFNDNLYRFAMVFLVVYGVYGDETREATFSAIAGGLFILPFFLFSALAGQLADSHDKAAIIRHVKNAEIAIMALGAAGLMLQNVPLLLAMLFATGLQSTIFGPIKYAILPQHLARDEVLGGTGLVEAGTYVAILLGTIMGGIVIITAPDGSIHAAWGAGLVVLVAIIGRLAAQKVPPAPPQPGEAGAKIDWNIIRSSIRLISQAMHRPRVRLAIISISFFWAMGAVLAVQFPPLVKNSLQADYHVATIFLGAFSVGVAVGSVLVNRLLKGEVSARFSPVSALLMGLFVLDLYRRVHGFDPGGNDLLSVGQFLAHPHGALIVLDLFGVATFGGMFVVPLYAYLTTHVEKHETARTIAANNIVNSGLMVAATLILTASVQLGVTVADSLLIVAAATVVSAWFGWRLHRVAD